MVMPTDQDTLRLVVARGGTSKGLYLHAQDLPARGPLRDALLCRLMGSPDALQIDGLGGSRPVTSKVAIVGPSTRDDADVDYTFGQVDIHTSTVDYSGNCGNISSGVGPFAVDEGLVPLSEPVTRVRIYNTNTDKVLTADVPVRGGRAAVVGDAEIAGVPGTGAAILMDWKNTVGAGTGRLLPTGTASDEIELESGRTVTVSICDAGNVSCWVDASSVGLVGDEQAAQFEGNAEAMAVLLEIRAKAAVLAGLADTWQSADDPQRALPLTGVVAPPHPYTTTNGSVVEASEMDLAVRLLFLDRLHPTIAGTGSMALTACSRVPGSVVARISTHDPRSGTLRIGHPGGVMTTFVGTDPSVPGVPPSFTRLGMTRTARRLMAGMAYVPVVTAR